MQTIKKGEDNGRGRPFKNLSDNGHINVLPSARQPRLGRSSTLNQNPQINLQKTFLEKMNGLFRNRFRHPAEFQSYNMTISLSLTRGCRALVLEPKSSVMCPPFLWKWKVQSNSKNQMVLYLFFQNISPSLLAHKIYKARVFLPMSTE